MTIERSAAGEESFQCVQFTGVCWLPAHQNAGGSSLEHLGVDQLGVPIGSFDDQLESVTLS